MFNFWCFKIAVVSDIRSKRVLLQNYVSTSLEIKVIPLDCDVWAIIGSIDILFTCN